MVLPEWLISITEYIGLIAAAISGSMLAIDRGLDLFGVVFLGITTALGGGILRDALLGSFPPRFFLNYQWALTVFLVSLTVFVVARFWNGWRRMSVLARIEKVCNLFDAIGLAAFTVSGVQITVASGFETNAFMCVFMGTLTGCGGGILRDIMCAEIPAVLRKHIYAVASICGGMVYWIFLYVLHLDSALTALFSGGLIVLIRILATVFRWSLPRVPRRAASDLPPQSNKCRKEK